MNITIEEFYKLTSFLKGMTISHPWKGYGSAIFLELGKLRLPNSRENNPHGEACITPYWEWRIEKDKIIICGSSSSNPNIEKCIKQLNGKIIESIVLEGTIPELNIKLSDGYSVRTMSLMRGEPQWDIKCIDDSYINFKKGNLVHGSGGSANEGPSPGDVLAKQHSIDTAKRWGYPKDEPQKGTCMNCFYYIRLDAEFLLLDYGVCTCQRSKFDASAVSSTSGCPEFEIKVS